MKSNLIILLLIIFASCDNVHSNMEAHQQTPAGGSFYTFKGKIVGQDSLRWDIDLDGNSSPEIFTTKEYQKLDLQLNDSVYGDDFNGYYIIRSKK